MTLSYRPLGAIAGMITGMVLDAQHGAPIQGAVVSTDPASSVVITNAQGQYVIAGAAAGLTTLRVVAPKFCQLEPTCITVQGDGNVFGDVVLARNEGESCPEVVKCGQVVAPSSQPRKPPPLMPAGSKPTPRTKPQSASAGKFPWGMALLVGGCAVGVYLIARRPHAA